MVVSQLLTLYTTPVIYLAFERAANYWGFRKPQVAAEQFAGVPDANEYERREWEA
jgi:hypothetical protein